MTDGERPVSLVPCDDYERERIVGAVERAVGLIGGISRFAEPGQKVLLKPNLLQASPPERCVSPHPEVVRAVAALLKDHGCHVIIADSPGSGMPYTEGTLRKVYAATGMDKVAKEVGAELSFDTTYREVPNPGGRRVKRFVVITPAADADAIVSVSKAKTHVMTAMTGAAKNIFGLLPGWEKPSFHSRMAAPLDFADMLIDLNELMRPGLQVMDAVMGMEGDGPHNGTPRRIGAVLASADYTALDTVAARLMGFDPMSICTIRAAADRGMVSRDLREVKVLGSAVEDLAVEDFEKPVTMDMEDGDQGRLIRTAGKLVRAYALRPELIMERCTGCGQCERVCPERTVKVRGGKARFRYGECIRCYCCHEMCPQGAIALKRSLGGRVLAKVGGGKER